MTHLRFSDVSVDYGAGNVVDGVSFGIDRAEWVAVVGPNGAGKSTLLRTVVTSLEHTGAVHIGDRLSEDLVPRERARLVAYVPQRPIYPAGMAVFDYVLLGRTPYMGSLAAESAADIDAVWEALRALHLEAFAGRSVSTLSGGETQRVSLARVIAQRAPILVLDEATSSLDVAAQHEVLELIDGLRVELGMTVLSAIHDLTAAGQFAEKVALLDRGSLKGFGDPASVLTEAVLGEVFEPSIRVVDVEGNPVIVSVRSKEATT